MSSNNVTDMDSNVAIELEKPNVVPKIVENLNSSFSSSRALVADYGSETETETSSSKAESSSCEASSVDSESDSSSCCSDEEDDVDLELPIIKKIEEWNISVPAEKCKEIGIVKSLIDCQVIVEPNPGLAALDLDSVLFLNEGERALGKIDDVFGPVTEPLYIVQFSSENAIKQKNIEKGMKIYYAPATEHTSFVPLPELMKMRGSDASWKFNQEPPPDVVDFSDDEEEIAARRGSYQSPMKRHYTPDERRKWNSERGRSPRGFPNHSPCRSPRQRQPFQQNQGPCQPHSFHLPQYPPEEAPIFNANVPPPCSPYRTMPPPPPPPPPPTQGLPPNLRSIPPWIRPGPPIPAMPFMSGTLPPMNGSMPLMPPMNGPLPPMQFMSPPLRQPYNNQNWSPDNPNNGFPFLNSR